MQILVVVAMSFIADERIVIRGKGKVENKAVKKLKITILCSFIYNN